MWGSADGDLEVVAGWGELEGGSVGVSAGIGALFAAGWFWWGGQRVNGRMYRLSRISLCDYANRGILECRRCTLSETYADLGGGLTDPNEPPDCSWRHNKKAFLQKPPNLHLY